MVSIVLFVFWWLVLVGGLLTLAAGKRHPGEALVASGVGGLLGLIIISLLWGW